MRRTAYTTLLIMGLLALGALAPAGASAAKAAWSLQVTTQPTNFAPGKVSEYTLLATNVGAQPTSGTSTIEVTLPKAWKVVSTFAEVKDSGAAGAEACKLETPLLTTCEVDKTVDPGRGILAQVSVEVPAGEPKATLQAKALVKGSGAEAEVTVSTPVQAEAVPPGILPGFAAPLTDEEGKAVTAAGSHPYQLTTAFGFPTENPGDGLTNDGHPRNFSLEFPRGLIGSPGAVPVLCTEAQLTLKDCPEESQVGIVAVTSVIGEAGHPEIYNSPLYMMVAPPGSAASIGTNLAGIGIFPHVLAGVRSDGDYGIEATTHDTLAFGQQPIFNVLAQVWGTPSEEVHDGVRGICLANSQSCPPEKERTEAPFLTLPADCPGQPPLFRLLADTWEEPSPPAAPREASYESAGLDGTPAAVKDCGGLEFDPTVAVRPTTNLADSPSGLDVEIDQAPGTPERASAPLRDLTLKLPAGLAVNPAQASGLGACTESQVGFRGIDGEGAHFSKAPQSCPDAAKIGTVEVTSPLLVARNEDHVIEKDPETKEAVLEALKGSIYIASPFANPFGSLVALYVVIEDEKTGVIAKLAGKGVLDPQTGQITTYFEENPELPLASVRAHVFGGARGALVTPPTCGPHTSDAQMVPWSAPEGEDASRQSTFQATAAPTGGPCPSTESQLPNAPKLLAGTESPAAGRYSPLLFKLSREDGTQRLQGIETTLPTGLLAKLAGVGECLEAGIARAHSREEPQEGAAEQADPSCPASSQIGVVNAAAGAGPNPFYTQGRAYLAGPYKGAPLSVVAIAAAVAGPFDLGTVVNRSALYLDPETGQGRVVSDPLPTILHGVPIDLRSVAVRAERPRFTLNPTSCDEKSFGGSALSTLGQLAPLFERFQAGGCKSLPYKPKMHVRLKGPIHRGGHPALRAVFTAKPGEANTAAISFAFPKSEFIDQSHFRTICTRVQFAANQCPAGAVYGHVTVHTPLLDYPLRGPAYLRSSNHKLPDLVLALRGPAYQPIALDAVGRVDSVHGGLRVRFETVPDAPFSKVVFTAQGAKKGLFQNSTNICKGTHRATLKLDGQNGKVSDTQPALKVKCKGKKKGKGGKKHR